MADNPPQAPPENPELVIPKEKLLLLPFYHELENEIKQSDRVRIQTDYFWRKWAPKLGPTLTVLVITLRSYCYYNKLTKERRDWCYPEQKTLAKNASISVDTLQRELKKPIARHFIKREARYRYDLRQKRPLRTADSYFISMDDPLTPEDLQQIAAIAKKRLELEGLEGRPQNAVHPNEFVDKSRGKPQSAVYDATANSRSVTSTSKSDSKTLSRNSQMPLTGQQESMVQEILSVCQDEHSRKFYEFVARMVPSLRIWAALGEVKDAAATGRLKKSRGAYFTSLILKDDVMRPPRRPGAA